MLKARMQEGNLPHCDIKNDVIGYEPEGEAKMAQAVLAGFPCQGVSQAGFQSGMQDDRSMLIKSVFECFDKLPKGKYMLIENVGALLHQTPSCRTMLNFIQK
ncbi:ydiP, partial [Symbiodinium sp. CCMP2456]